MNASNEKLSAAEKKIIAQIRSLLSIKQAPIIVAIDGGSGAGKSTLASAINHELDIALIPLDDFFSANIPDKKWDGFSIEEKLKYVFEWDRLRKDVIEPLLKGQFAHWRAFDFQAGLQTDGTYAMEKETKTLSPARVILIEGAYSASIELADLVDITILIDVPVEKRYARLATRENHDFLKKWHERWDEVEKYYFNRVRPRSSFDVVVECE